MKKIDVAMITKNSATNNPFFGRVLDTLLEEVPVNRLIIVDGKSTDETIPTIFKVVNEQEVPLSFHQTDCNRAVARQIAIENIETEWFLFLDDDVILCKDWFAHAQKFMQTQKTGLIWGWDVICNKHSRNRMKVMFYLRKKSEHELMERNFRNRGGLHDTLIRREAIEGIKIPSDLHVFEDWYIKKFVEDRGYISRVPKDVFCYHHLNPTFSLKNMHQIAKLEKKYGIKSGLTVFSHFILALPKAAMILLFSRDLKAAIDQFKMYVLTFLGRFVYR